MRQSLIQARNNRDSSMDDILSSIVKKNKSIAKKIIDFTIENQPNGYQKIFKDPGLVFTQEELLLEEVIDFLSALQQLAGDVEREKNNVTQSINEYREKYLEILDEDIKKQENILVGLKEKQSRYQGKISDKKQQSFIQEEVIGQTISDKDITDPLEVLQHQEITQLSFGILPSGDIGDISMLQTQSIEGSAKEVKKAPKYDQFILLLEQIGAKIVGDIWEETIEVNRLRSFPYKIIYVEIKGSIKTVLISDEIGQATFVYDGNVQKELFKDVIKGDNIGEYKVSKIVYGYFYVSDVKKCLENQEAYGYFIRPVKGNYTKTSDNVFSFSLVPKTDLEKELQSKFGFNLKSFKTVFSFAEENKIDPSFVKQSIQDAIISILGTAKGTQAIHQDHITGYMFNDSLVCSGSDILDSQFLKSVGYRTKVEGCLDELERKYSKNYALKALSKFFYGNDEAQKEFLNGSEWDEKYLEYLLPTFQDLLMKHGINLPKINLINTQLLQDLFIQMKEKELGDIEKKELYLGLFDEIKISIKMLSFIEDYPIDLIDEMSGLFDDTDGLFQLSDLHKAKLLDHLSSKASDQEFEKYIHFFGLVGLENYFDDKYEHDLVKLSDEQISRLVKAQIKISGQTISYLIVRVLGFEELLGELLQVFQKIGLRGSDISQYDQFEILTNGLFRNNFKENIMFLKDFGISFEQCESEAFLLKMPQILKKFSKYMKVNLKEHIRELGFLTEKNIGVFLLSGLQSGLNIADMFGLTQEELKTSKNFEVTANWFISHPSIENIGNIEKIFGIDYEEFIDQVSEGNNELYKTLVDKTKGISYQLTPEKLERILIIQKFLGVESEKINNTLRVKIVSFLSSGLIQELKNFMSKYKVEFSVVSDLFENNILSYLKKGERKKAENLVSDFPEASIFLEPDHFNAQLLNELFVLIKNGKIKDAMKLLDGTSFEKEIISGEENILYLKKALIEFLEKKDIGTVCDILVNFLIPQDYIQGLIKKYPQYKEDLSDI